MTEEASYTKSQGRKFGFTLGIAFGVLSAVMLWRGHAGAARVVGSIAGLLLLFGLILPKWLGPVEAGWMKFAEVLSKITTPIFMGVIYFGMFTVFGFFRRRFAGALENDRGDTAWAPHSGPSDLRRQF